MLTSRQQQLLDFIRSYHRTMGVMPSTREIQQHFGFASQTAAVSHLRALERKGAIKKLAGKARALVFPEDLGRSFSFSVRFRSFSRQSVSSAPSTATIRLA